MRYHHLLLCCPGVSEKDAIIAKNEALVCGVEVNCIQIAGDIVKGFQALEALASICGLEHAA
jgi:hypothetical protein